MFIVHPGMIGPEVLSSRETNKRWIVPEDLPGGEGDLKFWIHAYNCICLLFNDDLIENTNLVQKLHVSETVVLHQVHFMWVKATHFICGYENLTLV